MGTWYSFQKTSVNLWALRRWASPHFLYSLRKINGRKSSVTSFILAEHWNLLSPYKMLSGRTDRPQHLWLHAPLRPWRNPRESQCQIRWALTQFFPRSMLQCFFIFWKCSIHCCAYWHNKIPVSFISGCNFPWRWPYLSALITVRMFHFVHSCCDSYEDKSPRPLFFLPSLTLQPQTTV